MPPLIRPACSPRGRLFALRTVVLGIWTNGKREKKQIFEKLKEKKEGLQSVRKISTNVLARRLKEKEKSKCYMKNSYNVSESETYVRQLWKNDVCELYKNGKYQETMFVHSVEMLMKKRLLRKIPIDFTDTTWYYADKSLDSKRFMQELEKRNSNSGKTKKEEEL